MIQDSIVNWAGDFESYDVLIRANEGDPWYSVFHPDDYEKKITDKVNVIGSVEKFFEPLTEEEKSWERYNIDTLTKVSSYTKLYKNLKVSIEKIDAVFGTDFSNELKRLVDEEEKKIAENKIKAEDLDNDEDDSSKKEESKQESKVDIKTESKEEHKEETKAERPKRPSAGVDWELVKSLGWKIDVLTEEEKSKIIGFDGDSFRYSKDAGEIYACRDEEKCGFESPITFTHCPKCGTPL